MFFPTPTSDLRVLQMTVHDSWSLNYGCSEYYILLCKTYQHMCAQLAQHMQFSAVTCR